MFIKEFKTSWGSKRFIYTCDVCGKEVLRYHRRQVVKCCECQAAARHERNVKNANTKEQTIREDERKKVVKLLYPFIEYAQEGICDEVMGLTVDEFGDTWCTEHCDNFCEECVLKWLELQEEKNDINV